MLKKKNKDTQKETQDMVDLYGPPPVKNDEQTVKEIKKLAVSMSRLYGPPRNRKSSTETLADKISELSASLENYKHMYNEKEEENKKLIQENEELKKTLEAIKKEIDMLKLQISIIE